MRVYRAMLNTRHKIATYLLQPIFQAGLGDSDFRALHALYEGGPMPVNAIGPRVNLNPGSVSVAVDRLYKKGLVSRVESEPDRRVRTVSLTPKGRELFVPLFRHIVDLVERVFQDVSPKELQQLDDVLQKIGKRTEALAREGNESMDRKNTLRGQ